MLSPQRQDRESSSLVPLKRSPGSRPVLQTRWASPNAREMTVERKVNVWGRVLVISVLQESKTVWIAQGDYMDERIEVKGATATSAAALWERAARQKNTGNPE